MNILINGKDYKLDQPIKFGGEGEIHLIEYNGEKKCIKIYDYEKRTPFNERKIITLINRFKNMNLGGIEECIAYPEIPIYDSTTKRFCGFLMKYFDNHIDLSDITYSNNTYSYGETKINDSDILKIIDNLFFYLRVLHRAGFVLGDINPENILINKTTLIPAYVDFDSVQVGSFYSTTKRNDYVDPMVRTDGHGKAKYFIFSTNSDIYSLSIIAYELLMGIPPHFFQTTIAAERNYLKSIDLSLLDFYVNNSEKIAKTKRDLKENDVSTVAMNRLEYIEANHNGIFNFFKAIFTQGKRYYYFYQKSRTINIQKRQGVLEIQEVELISQPKTDPDELELFIEQFKINLP